MRFNFRQVVLKIRPIFLVVVVHSAFEESLLIDPILVKDPVWYSETVEFEHQC